MGVDVRPEIEQPSGWRGWLPWVRKREAEKLRVRIETIEFFEARGGGDYRRVCEMLEDATYRAEVVEGQLAQVCSLLREASGLAVTHAELFGRLDSLLRLSEPDREG